MSFRANINHQTRGYYYADSGDDLFDGRSFEEPKQTIQAAIDSAAALLPPPSTSDIAYVKESQGGVYIGDLELKDSVLFEGTQTTLVTTGVVGIVAASFCSFKPQTIVNNTSSSITLSVDGLTSFGITMSAMIVGGDNSIGVNVSG